MPATVQAIEVVWALGALATFVLTLFNLRDANIDRLAVIHAHVNGRHLIWATASIWSERMRLLKATIMVSIGAVAMLLPEGPTREVNMIGVGVGAGLMALNALLAVAALHDRETRRLLREYRDVVWDGIERRKQTGDGVH